MTADWSEGITDRTGDTLRIATVERGAFLELESTNMVLELGPAEAERLKAIIDRYLAGATR